MYTHTHIYLKTKHTMTEVEMTKGMNFLHEVTPFPALHSNSDQSARCPHGSTEEGNTLCPGSWTWSIQLCSFCQLHSKPEWTSHPQKNFSSAWVCIDEVFQITRYTFQNARYIDRQSKELGTAAQGINYRPKNLWRLADIQTKVIQTH